MKVKLAGPAGLLRASVVAAIGVVAVLAAVSPATAAAPGKAPAAPAKVTRSGVALPASAQAFCLGRTLPIVCKVIEPNVNQSSTSYPQIQFLPGDHVAIDAGGCAQTGGLGATWKRYVNPASDNGLYHGSISIPRATAGLQQLWTLVGRTVVVGAAGGLTLGYQDDDYSDNGYWGHDDGTGGQCKNSVNAWVTLTIT
jgi:hypothetical protein